MISKLDTKRTRLYDDPDGKFIHDVVLAPCRERGEQTAIVDTSCNPVRRISFAEYADLVEMAARGLIASGIKPGDRLGIFLPNSWEFGVAFHAQHGGCGADADEPYLSRARGALSARNL